MENYFLLVGVLIVIYIVYLYNKLISLRESARNDYRQIDIQLDRRYKVFEQLISAVNQIMDYEKTVLKDVVALRSQAQVAKEAGNEGDRIVAENAISKIVGSGLKVSFEAYPELKANQNMMQFQEEIVHTENKLSFAKQAYNDRCEGYNSFVMRFPANIISPIFGKDFQSLIYWKISEEEAAQKESYTAKF
ncbi:LemA family protein [Gammaproteobacteria bacterium]|nr:LemA family protein [Gammaproteobacteria bacterium]